MTNFNVKILGTANLSQMTSAFAKVEAEVSVLNKQLDAMVSKTALVDPKGFDRMVRSAESSSKAFRSAAASTGMFNTQQMKLNSQTDDYIKKLQAQKVSFRDLIKQRKVAAAAYREQLAMENMMVTRQPGGAVNGKRAYDLAVPSTVHKDLDTMGKRIGWVAAQTKSASNQMLNWGKNTQWAGRQLMVGFTMPIAAFGAAAGVLAYQVDKELTRITKVYNMTSDVVSKKSEDMARVSAETANIRAAALATATNAAKQYGAAAKDTLEVEAKLAATGKTGIELQQSSNEVMRVATLGEMDHQTALDATISLQSVFKMNTKELADAFNYMNSVENATSLELADFAAAIPIAAAPVQAFGGDIKELGILLTAMREKGIGAVQGANAIKASMQRLGRPSAQIKEEFTAITGADITKIFDKSNSLIEIFQKINDVTKDLSKQDQTRVFAGLFGSYQVTRMKALVSGMGDLEKGVGQVSDAYRIAGQNSEMWANVANQEMNAIQNSISGKFRIALETFKLELASMGEPFIQVATVVISAVTKIAKAFNGLPKIFKILLAAPIVAAAIAGPFIMLTGLIANLTSQFLGMGAGLIGLVTKFKPLTAAQRVEAAAAEEASAAYVTEGTAAENLAAQYTILATAIRDSTLARQQEVLAANVGMAGGRTLLPMTTPLSRTTDGPEQTGGKHAGKPESNYRSKMNTMGGGTAMATGMVASVVAMGAMAKSSNEVVDNIAEMVMYAAMLGPALTMIPWGNMASKIKLASGGMAGGLVPAAGRLSSSIGASVMTFARFAGPAGLIVGGIAGLAIMFRSINDNAEALQKLNDTADHWGDIFGYEALKPGQVVDPKTGEVIDDLSARVKKLQDAAPEVGKAIHDAYIDAGNGMDNAAQKAKILDIAIRQGLQVISSGGTADQARQAVEASLMAGIKDAKVVGELMKEVDLTIKFNVNKSVMQESLDQVSSQIAEFINQSNNKGKIEYVVDLVTGQESDTSDENKAAAEQAASTFWDAYSQQTTTEGRAALVQGFKSNMDALRSTALEPLFSDAEAAKYFKDTYNITDTPESADFMWKMMKEGKFTDKDIAVLKSAGIQFTDLRNNMFRIDESTSLFLDNLSKLSGIDFKWGNDLDRLGDALDPNYLTNEEAFAKLQEETLYKQLRVRRTLTDEEKLSILNQIRVLRGQERTGNLLDYFGTATKKWTGETDRQKKKNDEVNRSLDNTAKLVSSITASMRTDMIKGAMESFQQGIADATMANFESRMKTAMDNVAADAERRQTQLSNQQAAASAHLDQKWADRNDKVSETYQKRVDGIQNAIDAEVKADEIRQRLFEAEISRLDRLAEAANRNIDFNVAINEGNLDEAAKIRNDAMATEQDFSLSQAATKGSTRSQNRQDAMSKRIDAIEKEKDARLKAMSKIEDKEKAALQRSQARRKAALDDELASEQDAAQQRWDTRHDYLEKSLDDFTNMVAIDADHLRAQVKEWTKQHKGLALTTEGQFDISAKNIEDYIVKHVTESRAQIANDTQWSVAGEQIATSMIKGAFGMTPAQFSKWIITGVVPPKWEGPKNKDKKGGGGPSVWDSTPRGFGAHEGGWAGQTGNNRTGVAKNVRGLHPNEVMIRAQRGEFTVNRKAAAENAPLLEAVNSGAKISTDSPRNKGNGVGGAGNMGTGIAGLMSAMMLAAVRNSIQLGVLSGGTRAMEKMQSSAVASGISGIDAGVYGDRTFSAEQLKNAKTIANVGKNMGMSARDIQIGIMTAITESSLTNLNSGDRDSLGLFQQRPSMGWGTPAQVTNPTYAATKFFSTLRGVKDHGDMAPWLAAQAVQRSFDSTGSNYRQYWDEANAIFAAMTRDGGGKGNIGSFFSGMGGWQKPSVPGKGWVNTHDYRNGLGSPLYAASDGVITDSRAITSGGSPGNGLYSTPYRSYGETIAMRTASGDILRYAHLSPGQRFVSVGQKVKGGSLIGRSGQTGNASGPHTHFDVNGNYNAKGWMDAHGISLRKGAENIRWDNTIANLHKGESVLTQDISAKFRQGVDNFASGGNSEYNLTMNFGNVENKEDIARYVISTIKRAEARKPRSRHN